LLGQIAWAANEIGNIEQDKDQDYAGGGVDQFYIDEWPMTISSDWCGEFKPGRKFPSIQEIEEIEKMIAEWRLEIDTRIKPS